MNEDEVNATAIEITLKGKVRPIRLPRITGANTASVDEAVAQWKARNEIDNATFGEARKLLTAIACAASVRHDPEATA